LLFHKTQILLLYIVYFSKDNFVYLFQSTIKELSICEIVRVKVVLK